MFRHWSAFFRKDIKYYGHVISLGYNCEVSFQFFLKYHFVESSLFAWANVGSAENLVRTLEHLQSIGTGRLENEMSLWKDFNTGIYFHSKAPMDWWKNHTITPQQEEEDKQELLDRLSYLKEKFIRTATDGKRNLYIFQYPPDETNAQIAASMILRLNDTLGRLVTNRFDLLIITQESFCPGLENLLSNENIFIRRVRFFFFFSDVTGKHNDHKHYRRIFSEFRPDFKLKKSKKFKFEVR